MLLRRWDDSAMPAVPSRLATAQLLHHRATSARTTHLLHELAHLRELLDEAIDVRHVRTGAACDSALAAAGQDFRLATLLDRHRLDDRLDSLELAAIDGLLRLLRGPAHARDHLEQAADRPHLLELLHLRQEVFERERVALQLARHLLGFVLVEALLGTLD